MQSTLVRKLNMLLIAISKTVNFADEGNRVLSKPQKNCGLERIKRLNRALFPNPVKRFGKKLNDFVRDPDNENFLFIPSIESTSDIVESSNAHFDYLGGRISGLCNMYNIQVVIFDCCAGFSSSVNAILKYSTSAIIVSEPDSISTKAFRILSDKLNMNNLCPNRNNLLNKVLQNEHSYGELEQYRKFKPFEYDLHIREIVARAEIPSVENTGSSYGHSLYALAAKVFPEFKDSLSGYYRKVIIKEKSEINLSINKHREHLEDLRTRRIIPQCRIFLNIVLLLTSNRSRKGIA